MSDLTENMRRLLPAPTSDGHKAPSTAGNNPEPPRLNTATVNVSNAEIQPVADYMGNVGPAQRQQGNDYNYYPQAKQEIRAYSETLSKASVGGSFAVNCNRANVFELTLVGSTTLSLISPAALPSSQVPEGTVARKRAHGVTIIFIQDGTGGRTVTWPENVKWPGGSEPTLSDSANAIDILVLMTTDGGTSWYGMEGGLDFQAAS